MRDLFLTKRYQAKAGLLRLQYFWLPNLHSLSAFPLSRPSRHPHDTVDFG